MSTYAQYSSHMHSSSSSIVHSTWCDMVVYNVPPLFLSPSLLNFEPSKLMSSRRRSSVLRQVESFWEFSPQRHDAYSVCRHSRVVTVSADGVTHKHTHTHTLWTFQLHVAVPCLPAAHLFSVPLVLITQVCTIMGIPNSWLLWHVKLLRTACYSVEHCNTSVIRALDWRTLKASLLKKFATNRAVLRANRVTLK